MYVSSKYDIFCIDMKWSVVFEKCTILKQFNVRNYSEILASGFEEKKITSFVFTDKYLIFFENVDLLVFIAQECQ